MIAAEFSGECIVLRHEDLESTLQVRLFHHEVKGNALHLTTNLEVIELHLPNFLDIPHLWHDLDRMIGVIVVDFDFIVSVRQF